MYGTNCLKPSSRRVFLAAVSMVMLGCATTAQPTPPPSRLVVRNATTQPYRLFINRDYLMEVGPARTILVHNLPNKAYKISASNGDQQLAADIDPGSGGLLEFPIEGTAQVVDRTAGLSLDNPTKQDLELAIDGEVIGRSYGNTRSLYDNIPSGSVTILFTNLLTEGKWERSLNLPALQVTPHTIVAPVAQLNFTNDSQEALMLRILRQEIRINAGETKVFADLPPGTQILQIRFLGTGRTMTLKETLQPDQEKVVQLSDASGNITIENRLPDAAKIFLAGVQVATVEPGAGYTLRGLSPGEVVLSAQGGTSHFEQPFMVAPDSTQTWLLDGGNTQLLVRNRIGETVTLFVDDRAVMAVPDLQAVRFPIKPGPHDVAVHSDATGHTTRRHLDVPGGRLVELTFGPLPGRLYIENRTASTLRFFRNGNPLDMLHPGEWAEHSGLPIGNNLIEVLNEEGKTVQSQTVVIAPRDEPRAKLVVSTTESAVLVRNETGETVRIGPPARLEKREIPDGESASLFVPGTRGVLKVKGIHTGNRYDRQIEAEGDGPLVITLAPVTGGIVVENSTKQSMAIALDGELWGELAPGKSLRRDRIAPGKHRLTAEVDGIAYEEVSCRLIEDSWYVWMLQEKTASLRVLNRTKEALRIFREGSPAGVLEAGTEVHYTGIEPGPVMVSAIGDESGQYHRFTFQAQAEKSLQWKILPAAGGVRLHGFEGEAATISINGTPVLMVPAGAAEPISVPLSPGVQAVRVVMADGTEFVAVVRATSALHSTLHVRHGSPRVTLRNETTLPLEILLDGVKLDTVAAGGSREILVEHAGKHTLTARHENVNGEWTLKEVYLDRGRAFGWTVSE
jgi:hypothetical protein